MATANSPVQGFPYPDINTRLADIRDYIEMAVRAIERRTVIYATSMADLGNKVGTPAAGMTAWVVDVGRLVTYNGSTWVRIYPAVPTVHVGSTLPSAALGENGDLYFRSS